MMRLGLYHWVANATYRKYAIVISINNKSANSKKKLKNFMATQKLNILMQNDGSEFFWIIIRHRGHHW